MTKPTLTIVGRRDDPSMWNQLTDEWTAYMAAADLSPQTIRLRRSHLRRLEARYDDPLGITTVQLIQALGNPDWSPNYRKSFRSTMRSFYGFLVEFGYIETDPSLRLRPVRVPRSVPRPCPTVIYERALDGASHRDRLMVLLAAQAGLRRIEISRVAWTDLTDEGLRVRGKGDHERILDITGTDLARELEDERRRRAEGRFGSGWRYAYKPSTPWVFPGADSGHISADRVGHVLADLLGDHWTGHKLRHRFATRGFQGTHDLRAVQEALGHASPATTAVYTAVSSTAVAAVVQAAA